jgi:uncharacterized coiled-coil DUF342 family protein
VNKQTKIDDLLIQMISPKLKEIDERFSKGEGLSNEDINTLLLKSQFNHINHLDLKLDEVTADVSSLKLDFVGLKSEFASLKYEVKAEIGSLIGEIGNLKIEIANMKTEVQSAINKNMQWSIGLIAFIVTALKIVDTIWHR